MRPEYGKVSSAGSTIWTSVPCAPDADNPASMVLISLIGDQKSDNTTISASADGTKDGGKLRRGASWCSIACDILSITLRLAVGLIRPGTPTRSPPATKSSASANVTIKARSSLLSRDCLDANAIDGERSGHSHTVCAASHSCSRT